jgi:hypothetical protein
MGFYADTLAKIQAAITARLNGGEVESYSIGGTSLSMCSLETLFKLEADMKKKASDETIAANGGSRLHLANLRPGG